MAFTDKQRRSLAAKLKHRHVKVRSSQGAKISYVEGWYVISQANRIFGYDRWDRNTLSPRCIWSEKQAGQFGVLYTTKVRVTVRAGGEIVVREGNGTGFGRASSPEAAHEIALKAAETDATKRALATFGNPFGLALYDKDQTGVTRPSRNPAPLLVTASKFVLRRDEESEVTFKTASDFVDATFVAIREIEKVEDLYAVWNLNRNSFRLLKTTIKDGTTFVEAILAALKARARVLESSKAAKAKEDGAPDLAREVDLAFPKEKRIRDKEHLRFVARQPCLVCGRQPTHAHHVRPAQPGALGLKVSDEFTVPLCATHHGAVHRTGNERGWWVAQGIDPLKAAAKFWALSKGRAPTLETPTDGSEAGSASSALQNGSAAELSPSSAHAIRGANAPNEPDGVDGR